MRMRYNMTCNESCDVREKTVLCLTEKLFVVQYDSKCDTVLYNLSIFAEQRLPRHMLNMRLWTRAPFYRRSAKLKVFHDRRIPNLIFQVVLNYRVVGTSRTLTFSFMKHVSLYRQDHVVCVNEAAAKKSPYMLRSKSVSRFEMQVNYQRYNH